MSRCRRLGLLLLVPLLAQRISAQVSGASQRVSLSVVGGVVTDSLAHGPLPGALVQLTSSDSLGRFGASTAADSLGRFQFDSVPDGRYLLGFMHPVLDSLGLQPMVREVAVAGGKKVRVELAIPAAARLRAAICGPPSSADLSAVVLGFVRDARDGSPIDHGSVAAEWLELSLTPQGFVRRVPRLVATTGETGWFALCNVPNGGTVTLVASRGNDSTDVIEVQVPKEGLLRRELYLGLTPVTVAGGARAIDSTSDSTHRALPAASRLSGVVVSAASGLPVVGAQVSVVNGPQARTNERGEWTLVNAPSGTRMLEVRAVSYYPDRRAVNVVAGTPQVRIALSTFKAVLDTVKVVAGSVGRERAGFMQRRQTGVGRYLASEDIARRNPIVTSEIFRTVAGVRIEPDTNGFDKQLLVRGGRDVWCRAAIYVNGHHMDRISADELDAIIRPGEIGGIEVYSSTTTPPQFQPALSDCGSIVIWSK